MSFIQHLYFFSYDILAFLHYDKLSCFKNRETGQGSVTCVNLKSMTNRVAKHTEIVIVFNQTHG